MPQGGWIRKLLGYFLAVLMIFTTVTWLSLLGWGIVLAVLNVAAYFR